MMASPGTIGGKALVEGQKRGYPCPALGEQGTLANDGSHGETDAPLFGPGHRCGHHFCDIVGIMHDLDPATGHGLGRMKADRLAAVRQYLPHQSIFAEPETAPLRYLDHIIRMMNEMGHRDRYRDRYRRVDRERLWPPNP